MNILYNTIQYIYIPHSRNYFLTQQQIHVINFQKQLFFNFPSSCHLFRLLPSTRHNIMNKTAKINTFQLTPYHYWPISITFEVRGVFFFHSPGHPPLKGCTQGLFTGTEASTSRQLVMTLIRIHVCVCVCDIGGE